MKINELPTPSLILDKTRLEKNLDRMQASANRLGVKLRPHLKTAKSAKVAAMTLDRGATGITVSTLAEADYFAAHGIKDITYAVGIVPAKLTQAADLIADGTDLRIMTDSIEVAQEIVDYAKEHSIAFKVLIELDCGDHRGGVQPSGDDLIMLGSTLALGNCLEGVLTHAGHSYGVNTMEAVRRIAEQERDAAVTAAERLRDAGFEINTISVGSTPTALFADDLTGVTELRAGVYTFFDMDQQSRGVCEMDEIAMSVLASVIGHNRAAGKILLDAGGLALSKDRSADRFRPEVHYGALAQEGDAAPLENLFVTSVSQEHGHVVVPDDSAWDQLPVAGKVRVLPVHACMTAAAYEKFYVVDGDKVVEVWDRVNGW